jgi:hypothetical protein
VTTPRITVGHLNAPAGDDKLVFRGEMALPFPFAPPLYPPDRGVRVVVRDALGGLVVDAVVPGGFYDLLTGTGWSANTSATRWRYRNPTGIQGIVKVVLKHLTSTPGRIKFAVRGKNGTYPVAAAPVTGTMVIDAPHAATGQCGEASFPGLPGPVCVLSTSGSVLQCR